MSSSRVPALFVVLVHLLVGGSRAGAVKHPGPCTTTMVDPLGNQLVTHLHYDVAGRPTGSEFTVAGTLYEERISYDAAGHKTRVDDYTGGVLEGYQQWTFDAAGNDVLIELGDAAEVTSRKVRSFDAANRLLSQAYDTLKQGVLTRYSDETYSYNANGTLAQTVLKYVSNGNEWRSDHEYDSQLRLVKKTATSGTIVDTTAYSYDAGERLTRAAYTREDGGVPKQDWVDSHEYDASGNETMRDHVVGGLMRFRERMSYDADGNMLTWSREGAGPSTVTYSYACF